jgi:hypothetical protein
MLKRTLLQLDLDRFSRLGQSLWWLYCILSSISKNTVRFHNMNCFTGGT